jgi:hypothetical protein
MMRNPNAIRSATPAHNPDAPPPLRLQLDPNRPAEPYLDGAFWPRSRELSTELPPLLAVLSTDLGQIALVGYHRDAWNAAPGQLEMSGHTVHLEGFVSPDPPTMVVIANSGRRVTVRVVPPETDDATAAQAMALATHRSVNADTGRRASEADTAEARSLDELATRLARLPANAEPGQAARISRWVAEAADQFTNAPIQAFVPILVEHIVRGRLHDAHAERDARGA